MSEPSEPEKQAILFWDADCGFCRRWVERWRETSGSKVEYRTLQSAPPEIAAAAGGVPFQRIVLQQADGSLVAGAHAAFTALAEGSRPARVILRAYRHCAPVRAACDSGYRVIAKHRPLFSRLTTLLWGADTLAPTYRISGFLFPRLIGAIFLCAFLSLWVQVAGLTGSQGILPVADYLGAVDRHFTSLGTPGEKWTNIPSLLWFGASDPMLHVWLGIGTGASFLLLLGFCPAISALVAWVCYLSFAAAVPVFLNYQWDALLLETGLLAVLCTPWRRWLSRRNSEPPRIGRWLVWWLLFRLMFESGVVKLYGFDASGTNAWLNGTALDFHYFTQPIPVWLSWWFAALPAWFHRLSLLVVFTIELVLPFFIIGPRRMRMTAFWGFVLLMVLIIASGNYGFFNLLTLALCVTLVDDTSWPRWTRRMFGMPSAAERPPCLPARIQRWTLPWAAAGLVFLTALHLLLVLRWVSPAFAGPVLGPPAPFRSTNSYGLFSVMTTERPEITIEASSDGFRWQPYRFRYKMDAERTDLPFTLPHMPRLDWQMWFAALEWQRSGHLPEWMLPFLARLQEGSPAVLALLEPGEQPANPSHFRLKLDLLTFTPAGSGADRVWVSEPLPQYRIEGALTR